MIDLQLTGRHYEISDELHRYVNRKLARLDKYLPRAHRAIGMNVEIFRDPSGKEDNRYRVRAVLEVSGPDLVAEVSTMNPHAAVDIVAEKLKQQIHRYKNKSRPKRRRIKEMFSRGNSADGRGESDNT